MKTVGEASNELKKRGKRIQILYIVFVEILAVALIVGVFRQYIAAAVIAAADFIWYFAWLSRKRRKFGDDVVAANVIYGVCKPLADINYLGKDSLSPEELYTMDILPVHIAKKSVLSESGFEGKYSRLTLNGWELSFHYTVPGVKTKDMFRHLSGTLLTAERGKAGAETSEAGSGGLSNAAAQGEPAGSAVSDPENEWLLLHKSMINDTAQQEFLEKKGYYPADCGSSELTDSFDVFSKAEGAALPDQLAKAILKAYRQAERIGAVRISQQSALVFLYGSFYTLRTRLRFLPDENWYTHNLLAERDTVWSFFKTWRNIV